MELFNLMTAAADKDERPDESVIYEAVEAMLILLSPMVPHFCSEMWETIGRADSLEAVVWPQYDEEAAKEDMLTIVVQVRGKVRSRLEVPADIGDDELTELALADANVQKFIDGQTVKKTIVVKKKLVNIVV